MISQNISYIYGYNNEYLDLKINKYGTDNSFNIDDCRSYLSGG